LDEVRGPANRGGPNTNGVAILAIALIHFQVSSWKRAAALVLDDE
jgi:hypothetical protein